MLVATVAYFLNGGDSWPINTITTINTITNIAKIVGLAFLKRYYYTSAVGINKCVSLVHGMVSSAGGCAFNFPRN